MSLEDDVRRSMEIAAAQQASGMENSSECPVDEDVDVAFGFREVKKAAKKKATSTFNKKYAIKRSSHGMTLPHERGARYKVRGRKGQSGDEM